MTAWRRYALASIGPIGAAGAQFLLLLVLLRTAPADAFGGFSFLLILVQLAQGIWSALFCAPILMLVTRDADASTGAAIRAVLTASLCLSALVAVGIAASGAALGLDPASALFFAGFAALSLVRWVGRAHAFAADRAVTAAASDLVYTLALLLGLASMLGRSGSALPIACAALLAGSAAGLVPLGRKFLRQQFADVSLTCLPAYRPLWRRYSGWSLIGVLTTEATANCHVYIVTLLYGPSAFAVIAATALVIRPVTVGTNALVDVERAQFARQIAQDRIERLRAAVTLFRVALLLLWGGTAALIALLLARWPGLVFPPHYPPPLIEAGAAMWLAVAVARVLRAPDSAMLQAAGAFRPLALASVASCVVSILAVVALLAVRAPLWSILGILAGELVFAAISWETARRWIAGEQARLATAPRITPDVLTEQRA